MTEAGLITRLMQAAEEWGRRRYHQEVVVVEHKEPECCPDGRMSAVIELDTAKGKHRAQPVRCIATMELDGTISCVEARATQDR
jgi:hypothetical protein